MTSAAGARMTGVLKGIRVLKRNAAKAKLWKPPDDDPKFQDIKERPASSADPIIVNGYRMAGRKLIVAMWVINSGDTLYARAFDRISSHSLEIVIDQRWWSALGLAPLANLRGPDLDGLAGWICSRMVLNLPPPDRRGKLDMRQARLSFDPGNPPPRRVSEQNLTTGGGEKLGKRLFQKLRSFGARHLLINVCEDGGTDGEAAVVIRAWDSGSSWSMTNIITLWESEWMTWAVTHACIRLTRPGEQAFHCLKDMAYTERVLLGETIACGLTLNRCDGRLTLHLDSPAAREREKIQRLSIESAVQQRAVEAARIAEFAGVTAAGKSHNYKAAETEDTQWDEYSELPLGADGRSREVSAAGGALQAQALNASEINTWALQAEVREKRERIRERWARAIKSLVCTAKLLKAWKAGESSSAEVVAGAAGQLVMEGVREAFLEFRHKHGDNIWSRAKRIMLEHPPKQRLQNDCQVCLFLLKERAPMLFQEGVLAGWSSEQLTDLVRHCQFLHLEQQTVLYEEGASPNGVYLVVKGKVDVMVRGNHDGFKLSTADLSRIQLDAMQRLASGGSTDSVTGHLKADAARRLQQWRACQAMPGSFFGTAWGNGSGREDTAVAEGSAEVLRLRGVHYMRLLEPSVNRVLKERERLLYGCRVFDEVTPEALLRMAHYGYERVIKGEGSVVCRQGCKRNAFVVIARGVCRVELHMGGHEKNVAPDASCNRLREGDFFCSGDDDAYSASLITCSEEVEVLCMGLQMLYKLGVDLEPRIDRATSARYPHMCQELRRRKEKHASALLQLQVMRQQQQQARHDLHHAEVQGAKFNLIRAFRSLEACSTPRGVWPVSLGQTLGHTTGAGSSCFEPQLSPPVSPFLVPPDIAYGKEMEMFAASGPAQHVKPSRPSGGSPTKKSLFHHNQFMSSRH